jgi:hypothetical protein
MSNNPSSLDASSRSDDLPKSYFRTFHRAMNFHYIRVNIFSYVVNIDQPNMMIVTCQIWYLPFVSRRCFPLARGSAQHFRKSCMRLSDEFHLCCSGFKQAQHRCYCWNMYVEPVQNLNSTNETHLTIACKTFWIAVPILSLMKSENSEVSKQCCCHCCWW